MKVFSGFLKFFWALLLLQLGIYGAIIAAIIFVVQHFLAKYW